MESPWNHHGFTMELPWNHYGITIGSMVLKDIEKHGINMEYTWNKHGINIRLGISSILN